ncbi:hypothetical protein LTR28_008927, partial [Elasticomyces elasticus]
MSSFIAKLGLISLISCALAVPTGTHSPTHSHSHHVPSATSSGSSIGSSGTIASTLLTTSHDDEFATVTSSSKSTIKVSASTAPVVAARDANNPPIRRWKPHTRSSSTTSSSTSISTSTSTSTSTSVRTTSTSTSVPTTPTSTSARTTSTSTSVSIAPTTTSVRTTLTSTTTTKSTSASSPVATPSAAAASGTPRKRGVVYNNAALTDGFVGSPFISWAYNWASTTSGLSSTFEFVPLLWGNATWFTNTWSADASKAIAGGAKNLMSFNEPDLSTQANMSPKDAATAFMKYMMPFSRQARLGSPAVTNGGGAMGLNWLSAFLGECSSCNISFVPIHWYDSATNIAYFKEHITNASTITGKPIWLTEFGASGTDAQISTFLQEVMPWMDKSPFVERYSYFMVAD